MEHKPKKKKRGLVRSLALRPSVSSTAGSIAQGFPFPLGFISHNIARRNPKGKGEVLCGRSRSGRPYPLRQAPSPQDFPFPLDLYPIARQEGIQREKVWSCPVRQDRAVHRRSEACMAGAQLASLPWLTVDSFGLPPPFPLGFISHNIARRNPKGKGVVMSREAG